MYASLKPWVNVPYQIKPFIKRDGAGNKIFGDTIDSLCYPEGKVILVINVEGGTVTSTCQLYVDGSTDIKVTDNVVFEGVDRPIQRINSYYRNGVVDMKVVYL